MGTLLAKQNISVDEQIQKSARPFYLKRSVSGVASPYPVSKDIGTFRFSFKEDVMGKFSDFTKKLAEFWTKAEPEIELSRIKRIVEERMSEDRKKGDYLSRIIKLNADLDQLRADLVEKFGNIGKSI